MFDLSKIFDLSKKFALPENLLLNLKTIVLSLATVEPKHKFSHFEVHQLFHWFFP